MSLYWYWEKQEIETNTPSIQDGLDYKTEVEYRKEGAQFIIKCGQEIFKGCYNTVATGCVFFHRFYMFHTFKTFPPHVTAACCLFLAGKVEETPKRCKDIIRIAKASLSEKDFANFGDDPVEEINAMERILLQTIKFDLKVIHPYFYLKKYIKCLKANKEILQNVLQMAWNFVNDSFKITLSIEWEPEIIAIAVIHLAGKLHNLKINNWTGKTPDQKHWWDMFVQDLSVKLLEDICHQILDLYSSKDKQANFFTEAAKAIGKKVAPSESTTPVKEPKVEPPVQPSQPFKHVQPNIDVSKPPTSWPPYPSGPPPDSTMHHNFTLPNLNVPPPTTHTSYPPPPPSTNSAMPPASFPITNFSIPPPVHMPFPPANLSVPPPSMINASNYYGGDQYLRY